MKIIKDWKSVPLVQAASVKHRMYQITPSYSVSDQQQKPYKTTILKGENIMGVEIYTASKKYAV